jgi:diguanylate cyclase (GGDEF)-like protein
MNKTFINLSKRTAGNRVNGVDGFLRRLIDIFSSFFGLIILSPIFLLVSIAIKRSSPGPIFYWGPRMGKNGKIFRILKFRTMYERKESYQGPKVTAENDPRVTPLGRILRQTKINELPQLWNVLVGDMSLVGPRPEDPDIVANWPEETRKELLSVRPGITSPASVVYRNEEELLQSSHLMETYLWDIIPSKLRLDQLYVRNRSILTDFDVIFWTFIVLLPRIKSISVPEHKLYWGPLSQFTYRYLLWFFIDLIVSFITVAIVGVLRRLTTPLDLGFYLSATIAFIIALVFSLINSLAGLNKINWSKARVEDALDLALSTAIVTALVLVVNFVFPSGTRFPISVILISAIFSYCGFIAVRYRTRVITAFARRWITLRGSSVTALGERILIVGAGEVARFAIWLLSNETLARAFTIVGMVDDDPRKIGTKIDGYPVINSISAIPDLVNKQDIGLILFAIADLQPADQERILSICQSTSARIIPIPDILDTLRAQLPNNETEKEIHFNKVLHNATLDRLTGAYNKLHFTSLAEFEFNRSLRYGHPLTFAAISISYLHPPTTAFARSVAAQVVQGVARRCLENIRGIDLLGRYSDDVLLILLPETNETEGELVARRLKEKILQSPIPTNRGAVQPTIGIHLITNSQNEFQQVDKMIQAVVSQFSAYQPFNEKMLSTSPNSD